MYQVFPLSDWAKILIIQRFHHASRFAARADMNFQLLTYHLIARATLQDMAYEFQQAKRLLKIVFQIQMDLQSESEIDFDGFDIVNKFKA